MPWKMPEKWVSALGLFPHLWEDPGELGGLRAQATATSRTQRSTERGKGDAAGLSPPTYKPSSWSSLLASQPLPRRLPCGGAAGLSLPTASSA